jgi:hypothetical protein
MPEEPDITFLDPGSSSDSDDGSGGDSGNGIRHRARRTRPIAPSRKYHRQPAQPSALQHGSAATYTTSRTASLSLDARDFNPLSYQDTDTPPSAMQFQVGDSSDDESSADDQHQYDGSGNASDADDEDDDADGSFERADRGVAVVAEISCSSIRDCKFPDFDSMVCLSPPSSPSGRDQSYIASSDEDDFGACEPDRTMHVIDGSDAASRRDGGSMFFLPSDVDHR